MLVITVHHSYSWHKEISESIILISIDQLSKLKATMKQLTYLYSLPIYFTYIEVNIHIVYSITVSNHLTNISNQIFLNKSTCETNCETNWCLTLATANNSFSQSSARKTSIAMNSTYRYVNTYLAS